MKIIKYKKDKGNLYKIITDKKEYKIYDDIIIKHELLLKKEFDQKKWELILKENRLLESYYAGLKALNTRMRTSKELENILSKKGYDKESICYGIKRLEKEGYINSKVYIEAYIHDRLNLYTEGENRIIKDLEKLGFKSSEIKPYISQVDQNIYLDKIKKYVDKKAKVNKKSVNEFKRKMMNDLVNKGFYKRDINSYLESLNISENQDEIMKIIDRLYKKYSIKYDVNTTKLKIKNDLYRKGYTNINIEEYIEKSFD